MKIHYPSQYTKSQLIRLNQISTELGNSLCRSGDKTFRATVSVSLDLDDVDCKKCLKLKGKIQND